MKRTRRRAYHAGPARDRCCHRMGGCCRGGKDHMLDSSKMSRIIVSCHSLVNVKNYR